MEEAGVHSIVTFRQNIAQNHHIFLDNFCNSVRLAETLLDRRVRVLGTTSVNSGIPPDLGLEANHLKKLAVSILEER